MRLKIKGLRVPARVAIAIQEECDERNGEMSIYFDGREFMVMEIVYRDPGEGADVWLAPLKAPKGGVKR